MHFFIYQLLIIFSLPLLLIVTVHQAIKRQGGVLYIAQRFGLCIPRHKEITTWFHCASVGEVKTALPLINALQQQYPEEKILISTNTPTGKLVLQDKLSKKLLHTYMPWDFLPFIYWFLYRNKPNRLLILETEIWPALFRACNKRTIPISIINARLSQKTYKAPEFVKTLYRQSLTTCENIICQSALNAEHFQRLIETNAPIQTLGNLKWYIGNGNTHSNYTDTIHTLTTRKHITLISSHDDEELSITKACLNADKTILLVIIPRHIERSDSLTKSLTKAGYSVARRSKKETISDTTQIYLADTMGEVQKLSYDAEICIIGGSFVPHGGQNFLEVAALGKAILCGPNMQNFEELSIQFLKQNALMQCDENNLSTTVSSLLQNNTMRSNLAEKARHTCQQNQTVLQDYLDVLNN